MVRILAKTPLTAILFAALMMFTAALIPFSQEYLAVKTSQPIPLMGHVFITAYGLWLSIAIAVIFSFARRKNIMLILLTVFPLVSTQWFAPMLSQIVFGEITGVMTQTDSLMELVAGVIPTLFLMALLYLLRTPEKPIPPPPPGAPPKKPPEDKYKLKLIKFLIILLVLPVIYMVIYFLVRYLVLWRSEAVRVYYTGDPAVYTFAEKIVNLLLKDAKQLPMSLIKGLLYAISLIPLLFELASKRLIFILMSVMLFLGAVVRLFIPNPVMPPDIQWAHVVPLVIELTIYGAVCSFLMYLCMRKEVPAKPVAPPAVPAVARAVPKAEEQS